MHVVDVLRHGGHHLELVIRVVGCLPQRLQQVGAVVGVDAPQGPLADALPLVFLHFLETLVEGEVVTNRVLPACGCVLEVREMCQDPVVNVFHWKLFLWRVLHRHKNQTAK